MKYTILRQYAIRKDKYEIVCDSKVVCTVKASRSKLHKGQFNVKLSTLISKRTGNETCTIESDPDKVRGYLIYIQSGDSNEKILFGRLSYQIVSYDNYLYTIVIGNKLYKVRSCDLKDRRLAIVDTIEPMNSKIDQYPTVQCPETLFQVIDSFSKSNKVYHVTINDKEKQLGYLAIVILLDLHERRSG